MLNDRWIVILQDLYKAVGETTTMIGIALVLSIVVGIPLGLILFVTSRGLFFENRYVNLIMGLSVNVIRSIPYIILLVLLLPLTQLLVNTTIGPVAASVSLSIASIAFYARLVEGALRDVNKGVIEAATAAGATPWMITTQVLLREAMPGLITGLTVTTISLIAYSAMAGTIGGGGIGDLAVRFGYFRYQTDVMMVTVIVLVILVQVIQIAGDYFARKVDRR